MKNLKYFIPILGIYYSLRDMGTIVSNSTFLFFGGAIYHGLITFLMMYPYL